MPSFHPMDAIDAGPYPLVPFPDLPLSVSPPPPLSAAKEPIETYFAMSHDDLKAAGAAEEKKMDDFKAEVQKLQDAYQKLSEENDKIIADVKGTGFGPMKSVLNTPKKAASDEL